MRPTLINTLTQGLWVVDIVINLAFQLSMGPPFISHGFYSGDKI